MKIKTIEDIFRKFKIKLEDGWRIDGVRYSDEIDQLLILTSNRKLDEE